MGRRAGRLCAWIPLAAIQCLEAFQIAPGELSQEPAASDATVPDASGARRAPPKVDVYVINLKQRRDRCTCMESQLAALPANVYHHEASVGADCGLREGDNMAYPKRACKKRSVFNPCSEEDLAAEKRRVRHALDSQYGVFCSNYNIWLRGAKSDADFIVLLEDDAIVKPHWFEETVTLLSECDSIDYLVVDSYSKRSEKPSATCAKGQTTRLYEMGPGTMWTHMQVVRTSALPRLFAHANKTGANTLDFWYRGEPAGAGVLPGRTFVWSPQIVSQVSQDGRHAERPEACKPSVARSDVVLLQLSRWARLRCPET